MTGFAPINLSRWVQENRHLLQPPVGNKAMWDGDFLVMIVGGPNQRNDYHINPGGELFYQVEGDIVLKIMDEGPGFSKFLWDFVDGRPKVNQFKTTASVPASTPLSIQISKELGSRGFKFVGPTIVYAFMQATGMVNDHLVTCFCHEACGAKPRAPRLKAR